MYDREFRLHIARNPHRSWAMILQQAWSLRLKDCINVQSLNSGGTHGGHPGNFGQNRTKLNEACRRFNRGRCNYGVNCRYEHRCMYCNKMGHPLVRCRKANNDWGSSAAHAPGGTGNKNRNEEMNGGQGSTR